MSTIDVHMEPHPALTTVVAAGTAHKYGYVTITQQIDGWDTLRLNLYVKDAIAAELIRDAIETALAKPDLPKAENSNVIPLVAAGTT